LTLLELQNILVQKIPELKNILNNIAFAINQEYVANSNVKIVDHDEVALIPPVSGG
jgi:molybdopterin converting factor small subunit